MVPAIPLAPVSTSKFGGPCGVGSCRTSHPKTPRYKSASPDGSAEAMVNRVTGGASPHETGDGCGGRRA